MANALIHRKFLLPNLAVFHYSNLKHVDQQTSLRNFPPNHHVTPSILILHLLPMLLQLYTLQQVESLANLVILFIHLKGDLVLLSHRGHRVQLRKERIPL